MAMRTYEWLLENPSPRVYTEHRLGYLRPYFTREMSLGAIAAETGRTEAELRRWIRTDFQYIEDIVSRKEGEIEALAQQVASLQSQLEVRPETANQLLGKADLYQDVVMGFFTIEESAVISGSDPEVMRHHMNTLYNKVGNQLEFKDGLIKRFRESMMNVGDSNG